MSGLSGKGLSCCTMNNPHFVLLQQTRAPPHAGYEAEPQSHQWVLFYHLLTPRQKLFCSFSNIFSHSRVGVMLPCEVLVYLICGAQSTACTFLCFLWLDLLPSFLYCFQEVLWHFISSNSSITYPITFQFIWKVHLRYEQAYHHWFLAVYEISLWFASNTILLSYLKGQAEHYGTLRVYFISGKQSAGCN